MLKSVSAVSRQPNSRLSRWFQSSSVGRQALAQKSATKPADHEQKPKDEGKTRGGTSKEEDTKKNSRHVKRNDLGVQLLSRQLHSQIFKNVSFPTPPSSYVHIAREHLEMHGLDPTQGSVLPDTGFTLPQLQGSNLLEHFYRIGAQAAEPWLSLAKSYASCELPPQPDDWEIQAGWTKYHYLSDGASFSEHVPYPMHDGKPEEVLTFDVETMHTHHPYAVMATAASPNGWYCWISPWLLGKTEDPQQLIPLGDSTVPRIVVGHNVSYDRGRILEEYSLEGTKNRFLDTMALHIAVKGISSHQRPAWMKYRKSKEAEAEQQREAVDAMRDLARTVERRILAETDEEKRHELLRVLQGMQDSLANMGDTTGAAKPRNTENSDVPDLEEGESEAAATRWEELTSANSLADVAKLHCGIDVNKEIRNDFSALTREEIRDNISDYLTYCANDVYVTHRVYSSALPAFLAGCPHPVSFAGILTMGSSFLTVNEEWEKYLQYAEGVYREMEEGVKRKLKELAEEAKGLMGNDEEWQKSPWLSQLDWTPKVAGKSRGVLPPEPSEQAKEVPSEGKPKPQPKSIVAPRWFARLSEDPFSSGGLDRIIPALMRMECGGHPIIYNDKERWHYLVDGEVRRPSTAPKQRITSILSPRHCKALETGELTSPHKSLALRIANRDRSDEVAKQVLALAQEMLVSWKGGGKDDDPHLGHLDWGASMVKLEVPEKEKRAKKIKPPKPPPVLWPKWYWDLAKPKKGMPRGSLDITVRNRVAPILLRLSWRGFPLFHSREHGWVFRAPSSGTDFTTRSNPVSFYDPADDALSEAVLRGGYVFYKLPHKDGEKANVGSPLSKTFMKYAQDGILKSPGDEAKEALDMNAQCSYWISARDRILNQMVVWQDEKVNMGFHPGQKWGIIVPQVITMGTVTRRAIEKTWLTASNAKKNRVGSELKAMVRAPEGYSIVGADVDSEELWISSCMGDAQFGLHGATALGWMTLEGTKAAGTDLHSKTASILGISRDQAKVFNYSRIYGAGMRHAVLLLLQANATMTPEEAQKLAENLYASTKGKNTHRSDIFDRKFWFGGTESFVFNKLEEIALSDRPQTPALGCGVTYALSKEYLPAEFGADYMPSRINWVVQSSGVDYLHLLIVSMDYLIAKYDIQARYLISVHDELRYLVKDEDRYRAALALQIANLWTRSMFAYKLGMDDLPQGVAFFSAVDVDKVLRKEVDMPCTTPSQPNPIAPGESLDIVGVLKKTNGGSLWKDGKVMDPSAESALVGSLDGYTPPDCLTHRASSSAFLRAQATSDFGEVKGLAQKETGKKFAGGIGAGSRPRKKAKVLAPIGNGEGYDWAAEVERILGHEK